MNEEIIRSNKQFTLTAKNLREAYPKTWGGDKYYIYVPCLGGQTSPIFGYQVYRKENENDILSWAKLVDASNFLMDLTFDSAEDEQTSLYRLYGRSIIIGLPVQIKPPEFLEFQARPL